MQERYQRCNRDIQKALRHDKEQNIIKQCEEIEQNSKQSASRDLHKAVKNTTKRFNPRLDVVKDDSNNILTDSTDVLNRWKEYCEKLYENQNCASEHPMVIKPTTLEPLPLVAEVEKALKSLKNNESPEYDEIPAERLKISGESAIKLMHKLCIKIWEQSEWPEDWLTSLFVTLPKKGDTMKCENNKTIPLICHASKIILKIMAQRMKLKLKEEIAVEQAGFVPEKGTRNQIMNLELIIERYREYKKALYICFIDYRKALDTVSHNKLWQIMCKMGFPEHLVKLLQVLYQDQRATVRAGYGLTDWFSIEQGVRQGSILSPFLFKIYSEAIVREAPDGFEGSIKVGGRTVTNLRYADDVALLAGSAKELQELLSRVVSVVREW
eukprot:gene19306-21230_t